MTEYPKLISKEAVKAAMNITGTAADDMIDRVIGWFSNEIQRRAGQPIAAYPVVIERDAWHCKSEPIPYWPILSPVTAIVSVDSADASVFGGTFAAETTDDFAIEVRGGLNYFRARNGFGYGKRYRFTVTIGFNEVPGEIQRITLEAVMLWLKGTDITGIGKGRLGLKSVSESDSHTGITKVTSLMTEHPEWTEIIQRYSAGEYV